MILWPVQVLPYSYIQLFFCFHFHLSHLASSNKKTLCYNEKRVELKSLKVQTHIDYFSSTRLKKYILQREEKDNINNILTTCLHTRAFNSIKYPSNKSFYQHGQRPRNITPQAFEKYSLC